jgi:hypothetical protein
MLARAWYTAQCQKIVKDKHGGIKVFMEGRRLLRANVHPPKAQRQGGWELINIGAKSRALLYHRIQIQQQSKGSLTAGWLQKWEIKILTQNPPQFQRLPTKMDYLQHFAMDTAYITPQHESESCATYKRQIYATIVLLLRDKTDLPPMRVMTIWPATDWDIVWKNLHETLAMEDVKMDWYRVIHDIHPTKKQTTKNKHNHDQPMRSKRYPATPSH